MSLLLSIIQRIQTTPVLSQAYAMGQRAGTQAQQAALEAAYARQEFVHDVRRDIGRAGISLRYTF